MLYLLLSFEWKHAQGAGLCCTSVPVTTQFIIIIRVTTWSRNRPMIKQRLWCWWGHSFSFFIFFFWDDKKHQGAFEQVTDLGSLFSCIYIYLYTYIHPQKVRMPTKHQSWPAPSPHDCDHPLSRCGRSFKFESLANKDAAAFCFFNSAHNNDADGGSHR